MVLMSDGSIYGCGANGNGQLGDGSSTFKHTTLTQMTNSTGKTPVSISCGLTYTMVLMSDGSIYGCGDNITGQLGNGTTTFQQTTLTLMTNTTGKTPQSISGGNGHTIVLMSDGSIYGCGFNINGQLGNGTTTFQQTTLTLMTNTTGKIPLSISCGLNHTMVLMSDGSIYACGLNARGQLGDGTSTNRTTLTRMTVGDGITPITL
jgi:alpha-tubulin suppressor-like RCC1 family protein